MILQLDPPIPLDTPRGASLAHLVIDNGIEHDLQWVCFVTDTRECWTFRNQDVRAKTNITMGRRDKPNKFNLHDYNVFGV